MSTPTIRQFDKGTRFKGTLKDEAGNIIDLSLLTTLELYFEPPDGGAPLGPFTCSALTPPGTDGIFIYDTLVAEFQNGVPGGWKPQVKGTFTDGKILDSDQKDLEVEPVARATA